MESLWNKTANIPRFDPLTGDLQTDVLIIGGGITGLLCAKFLQDADVSCTVIDAGQICQGITHNTTAKITVQHGLIYHKLICKYGTDIAQLYFHAQDQALKFYKQLAAKTDCDFEEKDAFVYSLNSRIEIEQEANALRRIGSRAIFAENINLPFRIKGAVCVPKQAQFHPLKFLKHLTTDMNIYENTRVLSVKGHTVVTDKGKVIADNIIFACHYPITNVPGFYFLRQHQERSYVMALEHNNELGGMYYGIDKNSLSFRSVGKVLLIGGGGHRTGKCICDRNDKEQYGYTFLHHMAEKYYKNNRKICYWAAQDCMPHDKIPFVGKYSIFRPYWYVATGFKKWGMTSSMVAAMILSSLVSGRSDVYGKVFSPQRLLVRGGMINFLVDVGESISGLTKGLFSEKKCRCPHMGCRLEWNNEEDSWDCPCHGSRFDKNGELLDNPAQVDLYDQ